MWEYNLKRMLIRIVIVEAVSVIVTVAVTLGIVLALRHYNTHSETSEQRAARIPATCILDSAGVAQMRNLLEPVTGDYMGQGTTQYPDGSVCPNNEKCEAQ